MKAFNASMKLLPMLFVGLFLVFGVVAQTPPPVKPTPKPVFLTPEQLKRLETKENEIRAAEATLRAAKAEYDLLLKNVSDEAFAAADVDVREYDRNPQRINVGENEVRIGFVPKPAKPPEPAPAPAKK